MRLKRPRTHFRPVQCCGNIRINTIPVDHEDRPQLSSREGIAMQRVTFALVVVTSLGLFAARAAADDTSTCDNGTGDQAITACSRLIKRNPKDAAAFNNRGIAYKAKGDLDRAIADLNEAIRLSPDRARPF